MQHRCTLMSETTQQAPLPSDYPTSLLPSDQVAAFITWMRRITKRVNALLLSSYEPGVQTDEENKLLTLTVNTVTPVSVRLIIARSRMQQYINDLPGRILAAYAAQGITEALTRFCVAREHADYIDITPGIWSPAVERSVQSQMVEFFCTSSPLAVRPALLSLLEVEAPAQTEALMKFRLFLIRATFTINVECALGGNGSAYLVVQYDDKDSAQGVSVCVSEGVGEDVLRAQLAHLTSLVQPYAAVTEAARGVVLHLHFLWTESLSTELMRRVHQACTKKDTESTQG